MNAINFKHRLHFYKKNKLFISKIDSIDHCYYKKY